MNSIREVFRRNNGGVRQIKEMDTRMGLGLGVRLDGVVREDGVSWSVIG